MVRTIFRRKEQRSIEDLVDNLLTPDLKTTLANLDGAPRDVVNAVIQLLPMGSRTSLLNLQLASKVSHGSAPYANGILKLTPLGYDVIRYVARRVERSPEEFTDWTVKEDDTLNQAESKLSRD